MKKITQLLAGTSMLLLAGSVVAAEEPMVLSATQMDKVSAGAILYTGTALSASTAGSIANLLGLTQTDTNAVVDTTTPVDPSVPEGPFSLATGTGTAASTSVYNPGAGIGGAFAASGAEAASALSY